MNSATALKIVVDCAPDWEGAQILTTLAACPDQAIPASILETCIRQKLSPQTVQAAIYHLAALPMTDFQTLNAIAKRLNQLIQLKAESGSERYDSEISALTQYRRECTTPYGSIRSFADADDKAYHRQFSAIRRLLCQAEKEGHHEAVAIVKQNLRKGRLMRWDAL